ncbi:Uncharacterised protein [uncultured archaeon]|nr:Uncharacterised protein [uncultured archaeon]
MFGVSFGKKTAAVAAASVAAKVVSPAKPQETAHAQAKKKPFYLDKDYLLVGILFLLVLFGTKGFAMIEAPANVIIADNNSFTVDITNETNLQAPLSLNFYSPLSVSVSAPSTINPNQKVTAKITLTNSNNKYKAGTQFEGTIEAKLGSKVEQKPITLTVAQGNNVLAAFFSFGAFTGEIEKFTLFEWVAFWVLVIIAAVLLLGFIARAGKRGSEFDEQS